MLKASKKIGDSHQTGPVSCHAAVCRGKYQITFNHDFVEKKACSCIRTMNAFFFTVDYGGELLWK